MKLTLDTGIILQGVAIALISSAVYGIVSLNKKLSDLNGSVREVKVWKEEHTRLADERHEDTEDSISAIWRKLDVE